MTSTGTEPGDFVEYDMDLLEIEQRRQIRLALEHAKPTLEKEVGTKLHITNDGNALGLADETGVRFRATTSPLGRLMITDERGSKLF